MGASVVSGGYSAPILELCEQVLDTVPLTVKSGVVRQWRFSASRRWDARRDAAGNQASAEVVAVVASVRDEFAGWRQGGKREPRAHVIAELAFAQTGRPLPSQTA